MPSSAASSYTSRLSTPANVLITAGTGGRASSSSHILSLSLLIYLLLPDFTYHIIHTHHTAVALKLLAAALFLTGIVERDGWAYVKTSTSGNLITYTGKYGLWLVHYTGVYNAGVAVGTYTSTLPISTWGQAVGGDVMHRVRTVQAFAIIGAFFKISSAISFLYARFSAKSAQAALDLFNKGRLLNFSFIITNIIITSVWSSIPENAFFWFCDVTPSAQSTSTCISTQFQPPVGNSTLHGRSSAWDLVLVAMILSILATTCSLLSRRMLKNLVQEEAGRGGGPLISLGEETTASAPAVIQEGQYYRMEDGGGAK